VTPIPANIARPLIDGLRNEVIVREGIARELFPEIKPMDYPSAVSLALTDLEAHHIKTSWSDALVTSQGDVVPVALSTQEGMIIEHRQKIVSAPPNVVFKMINCLGGQTGWLYLNWAWRLRGWIDRLVGGVGLRRGQRDPEVVRIGDVIDFWRVESVEPDKSLLLRSEMKLPGRAWLQFESRFHSGEQTRLVQTAFFAPMGLIGLAYLYLLYPIHRLIFAGMIRRLAERAMEITMKGNRI
jgi:hypothetical protein